MTHCECHAYVIHWIPIAGIADIIHEYGNIESRADQSTLKFSDNTRGIITVNCYQSNLSHKRIITYEDYESFETHEFRISYIKFETDIELKPIWFESRLTKIEFMYVKDYCPSPEQYEYRKAMYLRITELIYKILNAELAGDHLHPDPRIL